jgi:glycosyltransferase involved in cell wall biosynthesis
MTKKVLFIAPQPFFQWRGSPIRISFNLMALVKTGCKVDMLTLPIGDDHPIPGVRFIRVANPFSVKNIPIGPSLWKLFFDVLILFKGVQLCLKNRYDVVHGVEEAGFIGGILARLIRARSVFEKHSDPASYQKGFLRNCVMWLYAQVEVLSVRMADAVIGTGPGLVAQVKKMKTGTKAFDIFDIPSSLKVPTGEAIQAIRDRLCRKDGEVLVTFVGSFAIYQGIELMLGAIPTVVQQAPQTRFVVIGGTPEEIEAKKKQLGLQGVEGNVTFVGKIPPDALPDYLAASDILLSPRISGINTPLKVLDYMKAGRAIAATDIPSNRLLLDDSTAVFAKPEPDAFARAILSLVDDGEKRQSQGLALRRLHESKYNFEKFCERLAECYSYLETKG